jgi:DNA-binding NarL/FixJ family response regulator
MQVRILIGDMPRMMCEILDAAIASHDEMVLVGHVANRGLALAIRDHGAHAVILNKAEASDEFRGQLLRTYPELKVVVMTGDGRGASLFECRHIELVEPSPGAVLDAISAAVRNDRDAIRGAPPE